MNETQATMTPDSSVVPLATTDLKTSQFWTVFLLSLFLGAFGAHRFYAKKFKSGIVQLLTFGGLGFWAFIDVIMILLGKFKNSQGVVYRNPKPKVAWSIFAVVLLFGLVTQAGNSKTSNVVLPNSSGSEGESAESFITRAVAHGAGAAGSVNVQSITQDNGEVQFSGKFTWRDAAQYQTFQGTLSGSSGNWHVDSISFSDPIEQ